MWLWVPHQGHPFSGFSPPKEKAGGQTACGFSLIPPDGIHRQHSVFLHIERDGVHTPQTTKWAAVTQPLLTPSRGAQKRQHRRIAPPNQHTTSSGRVTPPPPLEQQAHAMDQVDVYLDDFIFYNGRSHPAGPHLANKEKAYLRLLQADQRRRQYNGRRRLKTNPPPQPDVLMPFLPHFPAKNLGGCSPFHPSADGG